MGCADLLLSVSTRSLALEAELPPHGYNGVPLKLRGGLSRKSGPLPAKITLRPSLSDGFDGEKDFQLAPDGADDILFELALRPVQRGPQRVEEIALCFASRFGLFDILPRWRLDLETRIQPNIQPILSGEIQTQMLPLLDGLKTTTLRGQGSEFHQLRDYMPGMDPRSIDWKRSARMNAMVARETRAERNHQIMICVDHGHLMAQKIDTLSKLDHAINAALAMTWAGVLGGDNVGFYTFGARPGQVVAPRAGRNAFGRIRAVTAELQESHSESNHTLALTHLHGLLSRRSLVIIFSDFVDSTSAELLIENLAVMKRQHLVLYVTLRDRHLEAMAHPEDLSMDAVARAISASQLRQERAAVLDRMRRLGILCLDTDASALTPELISRYMDIKSQGLI
ncbi:DUF58 domain-containing protein [Roseovarius sp. C7]|uniref:DUF58 domain-containing protein n=1 Tax=Roseovarius sp. C7 TaxID=3398643 RepID=UPI0039F61939